MILSLLMSAMLLLLLLWTTQLLTLFGSTTTVTTAFGPSLSSSSRTTFHLPSSFGNVAAATRRAASSSSSSTRVLHAETSVSSSSTSTSATADNDSIIMQSLTPELARMTKAFQAIGDDKLRYKQLLYMANQLTPMSKTSMIPQNKVPGCLSTVYIDGIVKIVPDDDKNNTKMIIEFTGDSDGLLTKGLVALLVRGLSGSTTTQIQAINPAFIQIAGISTSLTPGRNNGFLNMLSVMKHKALQLEQDALQQQTPTSTQDKEEESTTTTTTSSSSSTTTPMYDVMMEKLQKLQPTKLVLTNVSYQHAGHAGIMKDDSSNNIQESHFELDIVANAFDGLNLIKRHQLIYMILSDVMPQIHALQIKCAKTPTEIVKEQQQQQQ